VSAATRVLLLGVDAGSAPLVREWAEAGVLPTFRRLFADGLVGETRSVEGFFVGSTWPSLYTGVTPARHGISSLVQLRVGTYDLFRCYTGEFVKREPFWNHLSRAGRRVAICDVPLSGVSENLNGIQLVEWGSHDANYGFRSWPPRLARQIRSRFGPHPLSTSCDADHRSPEAFRALSNRLVEGVRRKTALTRFLLEQGGWDFFTQVFTEAHCVGHQAWHLHDRGHPAHEARASSEAGDPVLHVYTAIDHAIGELLRAAGDDCVVIVLLSHGMCARYGAQFLLPDILVRLGVGVAPAPPPAPVAGSGPTSLERFLAAGWRRTPEPLKDWIRPGLQQIRRARDRGDALPPWSLDPRRSRGFLVDNGLAVGGIRLNLRGREPQGLVSPGADEEALSRQLVQDLEAIRNLDSGRPMIRQVSRTADLYQGEHVSLLPDLLVAWNEDAPIGSATVGSGAGATVRLGSDRVGELIGTNHYCRTGDHRPEGLFVAAGPGISPGRLAHSTSVMDFAPTLAALLDVELPGTDGRPIRELLAARPRAGA
jgi:predicted AlkP superfamily phosphohydrolase/phosphomutase